MGTSLWNNANGSEPGRGQAPPLPYTDPLALPYMVGAPLAGAHRRHVKGVGATFMALGGRDGLAWDTSPPPRDESRSLDKSGTYNAVISFC